MSRTPKHRNYIQATLYHSGEKRLGHDLASVTPDTDVRRAGVRQVAGTAGKYGLIGVGLIGGIELIGSAIDRSPTTQKFIEQDHQQHIQVNELATDPSQHVVHVSLSGTGK